MMTLTLLDLLKNYIPDLSDKLKEGKLSEHLLLKEYTPSGQFPEVPETLSEYAKLTWAGAVAVLFEAFDFVSSEYGKPYVNLGYLPEQRYREIRRIVSASSLAYSAETTLPFILGVGLRITFGDPIENKTITENIVLQKDGVRVLSSIFDYAFIQIDTAHLLDWKELMEKHVLTPTFVIDFEIFKNLKE
ncbi:MAG: hypothetical protein QXY76_03255 [Nitrososphaeria archaeon]